MRWTKFATASVLLVFCQGVIAASVFPRPPELEPAINFWRDVFVNYSEHQIVLHDRHNTHIVYKVLDFEDVVPLLNDEELWLHKKKIEKEEKQVLKQILLRLADNPQAIGLSAEAQRISNILQAYGALSRDNILKAAENLRGQRGLRQKTMRALMRSGRYLPYMEKQFEEAGLPVMLTRLPLVESSFNTEAYSKSGAAGVWQFMPATARVYMNYDEIGDERRDPWFSTEAAVKHLRDDYELLQDWPLAVTAYNFGRNGIARALAEINGRSLVDMIRHYEHPRWGFAGKNFYAEFLAAIDVEQNALQYFGPIRRDAPDEFEEVKIRDYVRYETLMKISGEAPERFAELNPSFSSDVQQGNLYVPPGKRIRVPVAKAPKFRRAYAALRSDEVFSSQRAYFLSHRVRSGETLSGIAQRYRTSVASIRQANGLNSRHFIRIGQNLKVPTRGGANRTLPAVHQVRSGETLASIARRYGLSVQSLQRHNAIRDPRRLQAGKRLKIPGQQPRVTVHTVRPGETLSSISRRYSVSLSKLQKNNGIQRADHLRAGLRLKIAGGLHGGPGFHVIRSGQTLETIARHYGVSVQQLAKTNRVKDVNQVRAGQRLRLPGS